jgi:hypothetical protein
MITPRKGIGTQAPKAGINHECFGKHDCFFQNNDYVLYDLVTIVTKILIISRYFGKDIVVFQKKMQFHLLFWLCAHQARNSGGILRSTIIGSAKPLPFFVVLGYHICIESEVKNGIYSQRRKTGRFQYTAN